jgi:hypothetical protein
MTMSKLPPNGLWVTDARAKKLEDILQSKGWGPEERTLVNGVVQLLADRKALLNRCRKAILASEDGRLKNAVQDMLGILDPDDSLWDGWSDEKVDALRKTIKSKTEKLS